ncbi:hypothetical protein BLS_003350 [Venturia inaequalis]|uniref:Major facilitator superfamily (MFS) profile domain-containing protein n=1 Tax=Venturia inaequalis TaxID=5025 RepID=A0A8H3ZE47_VENIN|nr:hypothetical protein BLS_003350 [Venturia inaequalis]KAE9992903.1 hypothetical protein EG327_007380 [Venturia inaequalis]RDI85030.1 hypothetical protein Vi05172_g4980 [Venturia inaequalis]
MLRLLSLVLLSLFTFSSALPKSFVAESTSAKFGAFNTGNKLNADDHLRAGLKELCGKHETCASEMATLYYSAVRLNQEPAEKHNTWGPEELSKKLDCTIFPGCCTNHSDANKCGEERLPGQFKGDQSGSVSWWTPIVLQLVFAIVVVVLVWGLPESPRWLANRGREQEAVEVLCAVFDKTPNDPFIIEQILEIREAISVEPHAGAQNISGLFKNDRVKTRRRVILVWFMLFMNQLSGINVIIAYIPTVLVTSVGIDPKIATVMAGCVVVFFCIGALIPSLRLDHMGRRPSMMWGSVGLGVCMMMVAILLSFHKRSTSIGATAFFFLFIFVFDVSINTVAWVYGPEILPLVTRTRGTAIPVSSHWL